MRRRSRQIPAACRPPSSLAPVDPKGPVRCAQETVGARSGAQGHSDRATPMLQDLHHEVHNGGFSMRSCSGHDSTGPQSSARLR